MAASGWQARDVESERLWKMESVVDSEELVRKLCCGMGWSGDGTGLPNAPGSGANDNGLCWSAGDFGRYARCCFQGLRQLVKAPAPPWMRQEIRGDVDRGSGSVRRFRTEEMDAMEADWGHVFCRFRVRGGELVTCDTEKIPLLRSSGEPWGQYEALARAARLLLALDLLPAKDFFVSPNIFDQQQMPVPVLTKARVVFARNLLRVPSYELVGPLLDKIRTDLVAIPWAAKEPRLFWRGGMRSFNSCGCRSGAQHWPARWRSLNGSQLLARVPPGSCHDQPPELCSSSCGCTRHVTNRSSFRFSNRVRLCEISRQHPDLVDAKLAYIPDSYGELRPWASERRLVASYAQPAEQLSFKYLISTDGSTIDDTRIYWMLSSGSLVFKQITALLPYGIPGLEPWRHFVPVREDFGDLVEKIRWARRNDAECRAMASRAKDFARSFFTEEQILHYIFRVLEAYSELIES
ncbi:unnamed protein product [Effrenium voratum]|uniref:Glycosyl transferase CAP10 domain-containing protein n=1 Tax=Effrenium voratum TaxID=2562239 RepID=A0AA36JBT3_9DINO|nr:unnamed protein product [Effrenium voratum]